MVTQQIHISDEANKKIRKLKGIYDLKNISQVVEKTIMDAKE
jgi:hypothetical protein